MQHATIRFCIAFQMLALFEQNVMSFAFTFFFIKLIKTIQRSKNKVLRKYSKSREHHNSINLVCLKKSEAPDTGTDDFKGNINYFCFQFL